MDNFNNLDMGLVNLNQDPIMINADMNVNTERKWLNLSMEDWTFIAILAIVILIILFASRPMVGPALDNMGDVVANNAVSDFVMSQFSHTYILSKKDDELKEALDTLKKPQLKNDKLSKLKEYIENDIQSVITEEVDNKLVRNAAIDAVTGGKKFRSIIAYSIINRMRRTISSKGGEPRKYDPRNVVAIELIHNACLILSDIMDKSESRRNEQSIHNSYDTNIALLTAAQLNLIGLKLVGDVNHLAKQYAVENQIRQRMEQEKINTPEKPEIDKFELVYNLSLSACNDMNQLIDGQAQDVYGKKDSITKSKSKILNYIQKKSCSDFNLMFEMSWIIGGGPVKKEYIDYIRSMGTDFGILYQIYDDFADYYSDQVDSNLNFVISVGPDEAYDEFFAIVESFVRKAGELGVMTGALKHIVSYLSDTVTLSKKFIDSDKKKLKHADRIDDDIEEDDDDDITEDTDADTESEEY